jgi:hypothetical protein
MVKRVQVTFDAADPHALAAWWAALLGYEVEDGHEFITGLLEAGTVSESDVVRLGGRLFFADAVAASDPEGLGPRLYFQRVPEPKAARTVSISTCLCPPRTSNGQRHAWPAAGRRWSSTAAIPGTVGRSCRTPRATSSACIDPSSAAPLRLALTAGGQRPHRGWFVTD